MNRRTFFRSLAIAGLAAATRCYTDPRPVHVIQLPRTPLPEVKWSPITDYGAWPDRDPEGAAALDEMMNAMEAMPTKGRHVYYVGRELAEALDLKGEHVRVDMSYGIPIRVVGSW